MLLSTCKLATASCISKLPLMILKSTGAPINCREKQSIPSQTSTKMKETGPFAPSNQGQPKLANKKTLQTGIRTERERQKAALSEPVTQVTQSITALYQMMGPQRNKPAKSVEVFSRFQGNSASGK